MLSSLTFVTAIKAARIATLTAIQLLNWSLLVCPDSGSSSEGFSIAFESLTAEVAEFHAVESEPSAVAGGLVCVQPRAMKVCDQPPATADGSDSSAPFAVRAHLLGSLWFFLRALLRRCLRGFGLRGVFCLFWPSAAERAAMNLTAS